MMDVDICVLCHNRADVTVQFLTNLAKYPGGVESKLWVLDNGSTDKSIGTILKWFKRNTTWWVPWARHRDIDYEGFQAEENMGFSAGNNWLAKKGNAKWILFLNNDVFPDRNNWLKDLVATGDKDERRGAVGPISNAVMGIQSDKWNKAKFSHPLRSRHSAQMLSGFCFLVRRDVFEEVGGWDEDFFNGDEDLDLSIRIRRAGYKLFVNRFVNLLHLCSQSMLPWCQDNGETLIEHFQKTRLQLLDKHTDYEIQTDLWFWEQAVTPERDWGKMGVMPDGTFITPPGRTKDQARAISTGRQFVLREDELCAGSPNGRKSFPESSERIQRELCSGGTEYHIGVCGEGLVAAVIPEGGDCPIFDDGKAESRTHFCGTCEKRRAEAERAS